MKSDLCFVVKRDCMTREKMEALYFILEHPDFFKHWNNGNGSFHSDAYEWCYRYFQLLEEKDKFEDEE